MWRFPQGRRSARLAVLGGGGDDAPGRQAEDGGGALAEATLQFQRAAVHLDQCLGERQAETGALVLAVQGAVDLPELAQGRRNVLVRHADAVVAHLEDVARSEEHTSELQSLMRISYAVFCLEK